MTWWTGAALGFDLETDGKDPQDARIITAATVRIDRGMAPEEHEILVWPERPIPDEAAAIHGITTEMAEANGDMREMAIPALAMTIAEVAGPEVPLVGHNASYDLTVLDRELRRVGAGRLDIEADSGLVLMLLGGMRVARFPVIDTLVLDKAVDRFRPGSRKLSATAEHYGVPMAEGSAHGATADVIASLRIAVAIANRCSWDMDDLVSCYRTRKQPRSVAANFQSIGAYSLAELHRMQGLWAQQQAEGFREHLIKKGDTATAAGVDGSWPLRTLSAVSDVATGLI
jgi:DNA polymerase III subunit epsilon